MNDKVEKISAELPDWSCEEPQRFWDPSRKLLLSIRRYQYWNNRGGLIGYYVSKVVALRHRFWSTVTGAEIPLNSDIGGGLLIPHPNGIVIHPGAKIGVNCLIFQQVTIGTRDEPGAPILEGHVDVGAGAKILGPIRIGSHVRVGANAVVLMMCQAGHLQLGSPLKLSTSVLRLIGKNGLEVGERLRVRCRWEGRTGPLVRTAMLIQFLKMSDHAAPDFRRALRLFHYARCKEESGQ